MSTISPSSENSVYFDAICCSDMSSTSKDIDTSRPRYQLHDDGPVSDSHPHSSEDDTPTHLNAEQHHKESEGWLPAVDSAPQQSDVASRKEFESAYERNLSIAISPSPSTRRGWNRKNADGNRSQSHTRSTSLARSASRKSTHTTGNGREVPGSAFVTGAGTTGPSASLDVDEEEALKMRATEAEERLTEKQKDKVRKEEGWYKVVFGHSLFDALNSQVRQAVFESDQRGIQDRKESVGYCH